MSVISLSTKLSPAEIKQNLVVLARAARCYADDCDAAFVKHCDPRALQGGAIDEEASDWRLIAHNIRHLAASIED